MENLDVLVLRALRDWRAAGRRAMLATVVRTWGSSPRPIGSIMALCESGAVVGSVSGGCIEDDLIDHYTRLCGTRAALPGLSQSLVSGAPQRLKYGISADEAHRFGLPCGGTLELVEESGSTITLAYRPGAEADCEDGVCALPQAELEAMIRAWLARKAPDVTLQVERLTA